MPGRRDLESNINDAIVVHKSFDLRGNVAWESIPVSWTNTAIDETERTEFEYDRSHRLTLRTNADQSYSSRKYDSERFTNYAGQTAYWPVVEAHDEDCNPGVPANRICGFSRKAFDARGKKIRVQLDDDALTDTDAGSSVERHTHYRYDNLNRLIGVKDPGNAVWTYKYNSYGDRTEAQDPALGTWIMQYDANGNLTRQTDAKNQVIEFTYDELDRVTLKRVGAGNNRVETRSYYDEPKGGWFNVGQMTRQRVWTRQEGYYHTIARDYRNNGKVGVEQHTFDGRTYSLTTNYRKNGAVNGMRLPYQPGSTNHKWLPEFEYDAAGRLTSFGNYITSADYDRWGNPISVNYGNGAYDQLIYNEKRGWLKRINTKNSRNSTLDFTQYVRSSTGRVYEQRTKRKETWFAYQYDYAGRLLAANNTKGKTGYNQTFTYDKRGNMRSNSRVGVYHYDNYRHVPKRIRFSVDNRNRSFARDANGNVTRLPAYVGSSFRAKTMTYDGENRPLSVNFDGTNTAYVYGADGARLKKIENVGTASETVTAYIGPVEIRNFGQGSGEVIITYPHKNVRLVNDSPSYLHMDQLGSVRTITNGAGARAKISGYRPFGEVRDWDFDLSVTLETKGFIGERFDADAGLQYLNARYYDPKIGLFIQPDWLDVTSNGVGTNRYAYSLNDPVNGYDPGGNLTIIVKGTDSDADDDRYKDGSEFRKEVEKTFGEQSRVLTGNLPNDKDARKSFAERLHQVINGHEFTPKETLNIVTHSHGRQVALRYSTIDGARKIDNLVTINGPVRSDVPANIGNIGKHIQAYNTKDFVASNAGGEDGPTWRIDLYAPAGLKDPREGVINVDITKYPTSPDCSSCRGHNGRFDKVKRPGSGLFGVHDGVDPRIWNAYIAPLLD